MRTCSGRPRSLDEQNAAGDDQHRADEQARPTSGSSRKTSAIATEKSGAVPTTTDVRDGPASRTASVKSSCDRPGPSRPARRNGQASTSDAALRRPRTAARRRAPARSSAARPPPRPSARDSAKRSATVIAPNRNGRGAGEQDGVHGGDATCVKRSRPHGRPARPRVRRPPPRPLDRRPARLAGARRDDDRGAAARAELSRGLAERGA